MRYATVVLRWTAGEIHAIDDAFARSKAVSIEAIRHIDRIHDRRYAELLELRGDLAAARRLLAAVPDVLEFDVAGANDRGIACVQYRAAEPMVDLLAILREHEIVVDWPMPFVGVEGRDGGDRALEIRILGTSRAIQRAARDLPDGVDLNLQRLSGYEPDATRFSPTLTDRQREVFDCAFEEGYYEIPRETTHRELADRLGVSAGTVGEHLQRIEAKLAASYRRG
ncbi:helix-turn-helix domain-containing protein [Natrarchaeobius sp. A-rgal3]|uniref:helix-turn-helix domain-containing protein n=1 Tax=Natrarchaeobius versutus TaxID=1679078 RepID=UPI00350EAE94